MHSAASIIPSLIDKIRIVTDDAALLAVFEEIVPHAAAQKPVRIAFVNAHAVNLCYKNAAFLEHLLECDYVFRDGAGMKILYGLLGLNPGINMNGTDLIPRIIDLYKGRDIALFGTDTPYLEQAADKIRERGLNPAVMVNGFHEAISYVEHLEKYPAPITILAMGMIKQEYVASLIARERPSAPNLIICGGAILDFIGGKVRRAPNMFRNCGMEWFYRLLQEPSRLFRRYVIGNFVFLIRALIAAMPPKLSADINPVI